MLNKQQKDCGAMRKFVVRMTTDRGQFYWDGASIYDHRSQTRSGQAFRTWGWLDAFEHAQRFERPDAERTAERMRDELGRLYSVLTLDVVAVEVTALGVYLLGDTQ
jgi:hypothetical protein